jgi:hypothetical protein
MLGTFQEKEITHPPIFAIHSGVLTELVDGRSDKKRGSVELGQELRAGHIGIDLMKQTSTEESDLGGSGDMDGGSKDDLQTVVEKPSPQKDRQDDIFSDQ